MPPPDELVPRRRPARQAAAALTLVALAASGPGAAAGEAGADARPRLARALQAGEVFDVPDTLFARSWVLGAFQLFNEQCPTLPGENPSALVQQAIRFMDRRLADETRAQMGGVPGDLRPSSTHAAPSPEGRADAAALLQRAGGCAGAAVQQLRKGLHTVIVDRASAVPGPEAGGTPGAAAPAARVLVVCWRGEVRMTPDQRAQHNPKTDGPLPVSADLPQYKPLRTRIADDVKKPAGSARRAVQAGLFPVALVEFPEDWGWRHAVAWHGARSATDQGCRFAGYKKEEIVLP